MQLENRGKRKKEFERQDAITRHTISQNVPKAWMVGRNLRVGQAKSIGPVPEEVQAHQGKM